MRTLALLVSAAAAALGYAGNYTPYPIGLWTGVKCGTVLCNHSSAVCKTVSMDCTTNENVTVIFVNSQSSTRTSKDAFAVEGSVDTEKWAQLNELDDNNGYDSKDLKLKGDCKGLSHLTIMHTHCKAECADGPDGPVTLVTFFVDDRFTRSAVVDCDDSSDKKYLLDALRDNEAVELFLNNIKIDASTKKKDRVDRDDPQREQKEHAARAAIWWNMKDYDSQHRMVGASQRSLPVIVATQSLLHPHPPGSADGPVVADANFSSEPALPLSVGRSSNAPRLPDDDDAHPITVPAVQPSRLDLGGYRSVIFAPQKIGPNGQSTGPLSNSLPAQGHVRFNALEATDPSSLGRTWQPTGALSTNSVSNVKPASFDALTKPGSFDPPTKPLSFDPPTPASEQSAVKPPSFDPPTKPPSVDPPTKPLSFDPATKPLSFDPPTPASEQSAGPDDSLPTQRRVRFSIASHTGDEATDVGGSNSVSLTNSGPLRGARPHQKSKTYSLTHYVQEFDEEESSPTGEKKKIPDGRKTRTLRRGLMRGKSFLRVRPQQVNDSMNVSQWFKVMDLVGGAIAHMPQRGQALGTKAVVECKGKTGPEWDECVKRVVSAALAEELQSPKDKIKIPTVTDEFAT